MSAAGSIDNKINEYLSLLNPKQKKAVLTVIKTMVEEEEVEYVKMTRLTEEEIERRFEDLESGKIKGLAVDEVKDKLNDLKHGRKK